MRKNGWNQSEIDFLVNNAGILTDAEIAEQLSQITGRKITRTACTQRRSRLGLKKLRGRKKNNGGQRFDTRSPAAPNQENPTVEVAVEQANHTTEQSEGHGQF
jgi:hypothetical protein